MPLTPADLDAKLAQFFSEQAWWQSAGYGQDIAQDMSGKDWSGLIGGLNKFFVEEMTKEPAEHGDATGTVPTAAGVLVLCRPDYDSRPMRVLLIKRSVDEDNFAGYWSIPGGNIDEGESPIDACVRECREELGWEPGGELELQHETVLDNNRAHHTFKQFVDDEFTPTLNAEHSEHVWHPMDQPFPKPIHPGVKNVLQMMQEQDLDYLLGQEAPPVPDCNMAADKQPESFKAAVARAKVGKGLVYDKSARIKTQDGYLLREGCNISKATINPYRGEEIPGWDELGLDPKKIYQMYRDPSELEKGAATFNGLPLLSVHEGNSAEDHKHDLVVGATGTNARFEAPYLVNDLVIWPNEAIEGVENEEQRELSCGYYYTPDMTRGSIDGVNYDGVMRDIIGNHVALVKEGRAGPDVVVGDQNIKEIDMKVKPLSRTALVIGAMLSAHITPKLATDKKLDLSKGLAKVSRKTLFAADGKTLKKGVVAGIVKMARDLADPLLDPGLVDAAAAAEAPGGAIGPDDVIMKLVEHAIGAAAAEPAELDEVAALAAPAAAAAPAGGGLEGAAEVEGAGDSPDLAAVLADCGLDEATIAKIVAAMAAGKAAPVAKEGDEGGDDPDLATNDEEIDMPQAGKVIDKKAMDAAIVAASAATEKRVTERLRSVQEARDFVRPWVGEVALTFDSAGEIYKGALSAMGVDGVDEIKDTNALKAILNQVSQPGKATTVKSDHSEIAMDAKAETSLRARMPHLFNIAVS